MIKRSEGEADHPPLYSIQDKSNWIGISTAAYHVVTTNFAQGQSRLYSTSWFISLEADRIRYVLCAAYKNGAPNVAVGTSKPSLVQHSY